MKRTLIALGLLVSGALGGHLILSPAVALEALTGSVPVGGEEARRCPECPDLMEIRVQDRDFQVQKVTQAMEAIAQTVWPNDLGELLDKWGEGYAPQDWAEFIVDNAAAHSIDPLLLTAIVWNESKFKVGSLGDHRGGKARSCGPTQVRTDFKGRPTCNQLLDPDFALGWTAEHVAKFAEKCNGRICLKRYNGGDYEVRVWRDTDLMRRSIL